MLFVSLIWYNYKYEELLIFYNHYRIKLFVFFSLYYFININNINIDLIDVSQSNYFLHSWYIYILGSIRLKTNINILTTTLTNKKMHANYLPINQSTFL